MGLACGWTDNTMWKEAAAILQGTLPADTTWTEGPGLTRAAITDAGVPGPDLMSKEFTLWGLPPFLGTA